MSDMNDARDAADEIIRLTADLAAAKAEVAKLRERLGPRGLVVVEIGEAGHYVAQKVADEIERLRADLAATRAALQYARNLIGPDEIIDAALKGTE